MFEDALRYPYAEGEGLRALAIGGILTLLNVLLLPPLLVSDYTLRVLRRVAAGDQHLPGSDDPVGLFVDGLNAIAVAVEYPLVPVVLVGAAILAVFVPLTEAPPAWLSVLAGIVALASVPVLPLAVYVFPAGLVVLARTG
jgi:hypothetical protein